MARRVQGRRRVIRAPALRSPAARCAPAHGRLASLALAGLAGLTLGFSPAVDYAVHCQGCHLADGSATPGSVPSLASSVGALSRTPAGRAYLVQVPGVAHAPLDDRELAVLLNWVVARFGGAEAGRGFEPYSGEEIGRLRAEPLLDVEAARRRALSAAMPPR